MRYSSPGTNTTGHRSQHYSVLMFNNSEIRLCRVFDTQSYNRPGDTGNCPEALRRWSVPARIESVESDSAAQLLGHWLHPYS